MLNGKWKMANGVWGVGHGATRGWGRKAIADDECSGKNKEIQYICQKVALIKLISRAATVCTCVYLLGTATRYLPLPLPTLPFP